MEENICFKWANYNNNICRVFSELWDTNSLLDVTISAEGRQIKAHRLILCACSEYFRSILDNFEDNQPVIILSNVKYEDIKLIIHFIYAGEINVDTSNIYSILDLARELKIYGLMDFDEFGNITLNCNTISSSSENLLHGNVEELRDSCVVLDAHNSTSEDCHSEGQIGIFAKCQDYDTESYIQISIPEESNHPSCNDNESITMKSNKLLFKIPSKFCKPEEHIENTVRYENICINENQEMENVEYVCQTAENKKNKLYDKNTLEQALDEIRAGNTLAKVSLMYNIPRSSLYNKAKANNALLVTRNERSDATINTAIDAVINCGCSLSEASKKFSIPKTVLWRRIKKYNKNYGGIKKYKNLTMNKFSVQRSEAIKALEKGESITTVSINYQIPKSTLFREKARLVELGRLPKSCLRKRGQECKKRLEEAVSACRQGLLSQSAAAHQYNVSKTTIWRHMQQNSQNSSTDCVEMAPFFSSKNISSEETALERSSIKQEC